MSYQLSRAYLDPLPIADLNLSAPQQDFQVVPSGLPDPASPCIMIPIFNVGMRMPHYVQHEQQGFRGQPERDYDRRHRHDDRHRRDRERRDRDRPDDNYMERRTVSRREPRDNGRRSRDRDRDRDRERSRDRDRERDRERGDWPPPPPPLPSAMVLADERHHAGIPRVWDMDPDPRDVERHERQLQLQHAAAAAAAAAANSQQLAFLPNAILPQPFLAPQSMMLAGPSPMDTAALINMNLAASAALQQQQEPPEMLYRSQQPNNTVMIRGLTQHVTENDIRQEILNMNLTPKDIRLIRKRDSGASRGFAFVEFSTVQEAARWMELKQGILAVGDGHRALMQYSLPKEGLAMQGRPLLQDWYCIKCGAHNFKRREQCFKCGSERAESEMSTEACDEVSPHPTNTLLLRGLTAHATEETVLTELQRRETPPIRSVRLGRHPTTNVSRRVCYLEMASVVDAMHLSNQMQADPLRIGSRPLVVNYCRLPDQLSGSEAAAVDTSRMSILELAEYSAKLYAKTPDEYETYRQYYEDYYKTHGTSGAPGTAGSSAVAAGAAAASASTGSESQSDSANAAAAVAQTAMQRVQKKPTAAVGPQPAPQAESPPAGAAPAPAQPTVVFDEEATYSAPDVNTFQYDETSGYYYDASTGLYYDGSSQYFYNSATQKYLYWDSAKSKYLPMPVDGEQPITEKKKKEDKDVKVKVAKKIAKDMERWAKSMKKKEARATASPIIPVGLTAQERSARSADIGYAMFEKRAAAETQAALLAPSAAAAAEMDAPPPNSGLVAAYGGESGDEEEGGGGAETDPSLVDLNKLACLLCKRAFGSREQLQKHLDKSALHRKNLEEHMRAQGGGGGGDAAGGAYRDRAAERRSKYGEPNKAPAAARRPSAPAAAPAPGVDASGAMPAKPVLGIGNKMMQSMGWKDGQGLGKANQGRTTLVEADRRANSAGLGMAGASYGATAANTYKECVKKTMMARYKELNEEEQQQQEA